MKKVITYGTFDLLHIGHINLLRRAKELGDYLIVGLSTDEFNLEKGKQSFQSYEYRKTMLESLRFVDEVIPEISWIQKSSDIKINEIDTFVIGDDWQGKFDQLSLHCEVTYLKRTEGISTTLLKKKFKLIQNDLITKII
jgi:glycerol-3-phosphate cytidylyltransferase